MTYASFSSLHSGCGIACDLRHPTCRVHLGPSSTNEIIATENCSQCGAENISKSHSCRRCGSKNFVNKHNPNISTNKEEETGGPNGEDKIDLACLLNILDGTLETPGRILIITTNYPYMSPCDVQAIHGLYDNNQNSRVICDK